MFTFIIIPTGESPFYTHWCDEEKFPEKGGMAINLVTNEFSTDGKKWEPIEEDHL